MSGAVTTPSSADPGSLQSLTQSFSAAQISARPIRLTIPFSRSHHPTLSRSLSDISSPDSAQDSPSRPPRLIHRTSGSSISSSSSSSSESESDYPIHHLRHPHQQHRRAPAFPEPKVVHAPSKESLKGSQRIAKIPSMPSLKPRGSFANLVASAGGWGRFMGVGGGSKARDNVRVAGVDERLGFE